MSVKDTQQPRVAMVAGETSGDLLAGLLLDGLQRQWPQVQALGIGGPHMQQRGFEALWPSERLAVHGYSFEVLMRLWDILSIRRQLRARLLQDRPDVFVGIDAPDFNLGLEQDLRAAGIKTVHFVCPSIWAWRAERVHKIRAAADHVLCLFPFEPDLLAQHGIAATYVGHPLAQVIPMEPDRAAARVRLGLVQEHPVLALLPGSRRAEVQYIAKPFMQAATLLRQQWPDLQVVLPAVPALHDRLVALSQELGVSAWLKIVRGQSHDVLAACDCTLIASGTATLEAALFKRPMVISYNMHPWSYRLMQRKQLQPWVGLPNILCSDFVVPELLQDQASPQALAHAVAQWLDDSAHARAKVQVVEQRFAALHRSLHKDTTTLSAHAIQKFSLPEQGSLPWHAPGLVAGVDEAGRGPLAGPVVAAAVILDDLHPIAGLADSKKLTALRREKLFDEIRAKALCFCIAEASVEEIDRLNILQATLLAMQRAVYGLRLKPALVQVDGNRLPVLEVQAEAIVKGDALVQAISAASILAKVHRDRWCEGFDREYPGYGFAAHKGYGTDAHLQALRGLGATPAHRRSFAPVAQVIHTFAARETAATTA